MIDWYTVKDIDQIDTPALLVYPDKVKQNIDLAVRITKDITRLRPHVKTNKMREVCSLMLEAGINKFKCATIAEAEMLAMILAPDVLLAYQPVGPKALRLIELIKAYPGTKFSCLIDNINNTQVISDLCKNNGVSIDIYVDLNVGMNRTGIKPENTENLIKEIIKLPNIHIVGLHGYDGHIHDESPEERQKAADISFSLAEKVLEKIKPYFDYPLTIIMGGTPTFPAHISHANCELSPGTFVFWDYGYKHMLKDLPFEYAALVATRIISIVDEHHICVDLGYKSIAAENPLPRVHFLNAPEAIPVAHSEEHLVLEVPDSKSYTLGNVLYGVPKHICPTVALYDIANTIDNNEATGQWKVIARNRFINY
ncbi:D-TA family PLP-dependent enzyme [Dysgonomonas macrotermitis]|uniref:D-serine deaminase, pyridoxal phosphate-dependent n=1 Tax=Dysgonomonas macrotermitis TaxID=1346286 RepID=A0A1M5D6T1_9BACT|nr:D-TA family PLP-dependent enzyme [Dysgonomonas macrotermitis]SHF62694.1 D-serine deaminase, pyridoxal phosphate-dependent [Dysgonomonas macrotermitis]